MRCCQYAYSLYAFDEDAKWAVDVWTEETQKEIDHLMALPDEQIRKETVSNAFLPFDLPGMTWETERKEEGFAFDEQAAVPLQQTDGIYTLIADFENVSETENGQTVMGTVMMPVTYTKEETDALGAGSVIENCKVQSIQEKNSENGQYYYINDRQAILWNSPWDDREVWYSIYPTDEIKKTAAENQKFLVSPFCVFYDEMAAFSGDQKASQVMQLKTFFDRYGQEIPLEIVVEHGRAEQISYRYSP